MTLYQIADEYLQLLDMMQDPEVDPEVIRDTLDGMQGEIEDKADSYAVVMKELEADIAKYQAEVKRLNKSIKSMTDNLDRLKLSLLNAMVATGNQKFQTEHFKFAVQKNGGSQPLWIDEDISSIPEEYIKRKPEPDKDKIKEALKEGKELPFAHFEERGVHLSIK